MLDGEVWEERRFRKEFSFWVSRVREKKRRGRERDRRTMLTGFGLDVFYIGSGNVPHDWLFTK